LWELDIFELGRLEFVDQVKEASLFVGKVLVPEGGADGEFGPAGNISGDEL